MIYPTPTRSTAQMSPLAFHPHDLNIGCVHFILFKFYREIPRSWWARFGLGRLPAQVTTEVIVYETRPHLKPVRCFLISCTSLSLRSDDAILTDPSNLPSVLATDRDNLHLWWDDRLELSVLFHFKWFRLSWHTLYVHGVLTLAKVNPFFRLRSSAVLI